MAQNSSSSVQGGCQYGFLQPVPVTTAVETGASVGAGEIQDHGSPILIVLACEPSFGGMGVMASFVFVLIVQHRYPQNRGNT